MKSFFKITTICTLFIAFGATSQQARAQVGYTKTYNHAVVVSVSKKASKVGQQILIEGGNAIDAAVSVQFALEVAHPRNGNIGGGGFMVVHLKDGTNQALDFREKAPRKASRNMYIRDGKYQPKLSLHSTISSGVPGSVDGMVKAEKRYGNLTLKKVMAPAIKLAENGYKLTWLQAHDLNTNAKAFGKYKSSTKYFTKQDGKPYKEGDLFIQKDLAKTLKRIANKGRAGFYSGKTADLIVKEMKETGGIISKKDLENYKSKWRTPVVANFHGYTLHIMPSPSSGGIAITQMLDMLKPYNLKKLGFNSAKYLHLLTEVMRRAFADRAYFMGDQDFVDIPRDTLLSKSYNKNRMKSFSWHHATRSKNLSHGKIPSFHESKHTTNYGVVDKQGNAVDVTTTLNESYGNHLAIEGAGFLMNDEMDDFASQPGKPNLYGLVQGEANAIKPNKRPLSSMSPTIVTKNGHISMTLGAAGGPTIINTTFETFLDRAIFGMSAQKAIAAPRIHNQWLPDKLLYEKNTISKDTRATLQFMGHHLQPFDHMGVGNVIYVTKNGKRQGGVDPRSNGAAEGY